MENKSDELLPEVEKLRAQLAEAEETLRAICKGEVDALVVSTPQGDQVFTLKGAERPYRILMEKMKDGAVTLAGDDTIFYCNQGFADMLKIPLEKMIGAGISKFVSPVDKAVFEELLRQGKESGSKGEATFLAGDGTAVPTHLSINAMLLDGLSTVYLVATDITERKLAEEALQKAHGELEIKVEKRTTELTSAKMYAESIVETVREPLMVLNADLSVKTVNQAFYNTFKVSPEETVGRFIYDLGNRQWDIPKLRELLEEIIPRNTRVRDFEVDHEFQTIGRRMMLLNARRIYQEGIGTQMILLTIEDITERKQAEEALKESEQRWATTLTSIGDAVISSDAEGRINFMNSVAEALTGWTQAEASKKTVKEVFNIINEYTRAEVEDPVARVLQEGMIIGLANHTILVRKDGTEVPIDDSGAPIRDGEGKTMGVVLVFRDISERKRAEEALAHSSRKVSEILESITDGFMAIDDNWRFTYVNQRAAGNLGVKPKDLIGQNIWEKFPAIKDTDHEIYYRKAMQQHEPQYFEMDSVLTDRWYEIRVYPSTEGISVFWQDKTERKQAEEALQKAHDQLEIRVQERTAELAESLKEKEVLLKEIHHRVKNNMQVISSLLMLQEDLSKDKKVIELLKDSQNRISSMALIHERLYRSGNLSKVDLKDYIDDLVSGLFQSYGVSESRVALNINVENVLLSIDSAIPCGLIINELVSNSLKHAFPGDKKGKIKISLHLTDEDIIELLVGDSGTGIPGYIDFKKTQSLGLYLVTLLVENQLHGEIKLNRNKGTEFQIRFREMK